MMTPGDTAATVVVPRTTLRPLYHDTGTPNGRTPHKQNVSKQDLRDFQGEVVLSEHFYSHGLRHLRHFPSDNPVRFLMYSEAAASLITLDSANSVCLYGAHGHKRTIPARLPFLGLTATKLSGCIVGWGPGAKFTLLDSELCPLDEAPDGLDIRVCQAAEHSTELVTAGAGNVCVWSVMLMRCKLKIQEGLERRVFTHMALAPPRSDRHHRALVACGKAVTVVDLDDGKVSTHKSSLNWTVQSDITAMVYCAQLDCVIIGSRDGCIRVWSLDWEPQRAFSGHKGVANSLFFCSETSTLIASTEECTICRWNVEEHEPIECIDTEQKSPLLHIGGTRKGDTFFSFSHQGVDVWTFWSLYSLHCPLAGDDGAPLKQILVTQFPVPYPTRVLCVSGDDKITLVASDTGEVLTSFTAKYKILCADYCLHKEILLALTEDGTVLQANTLTNPITLMHEWRGRGQGPWQQADCLTESDEQRAGTPGPACCLVLYSSVTDTQRALDEWRNLQDRRGCSHRNKAALADVTNKFLIILGQSGGCVSVLKMSNGKVMCRMPAHGGQTVTGVQVYPENSYLLSIGEDQTVVVWKVNPYVDDCLTPQMNLHCGPSHVFLAALGPQLAITFQDPDRHFYALKHFNLLRQSPTNRQPTTGHLDHFTGLCVFPEKKVFVSSSLDKTLHFWNEKNHLIRTLQLNAVPECLGHGGCGGELFFGIKGDLYKMNCAKLLRGSYRPAAPGAYCVEPPPDSPIPCSPKTVSIDERGGSGSVTRDQSSLPADTSDEKHLILTLNMDVEELVQGSVKCKKAKPPSTKQTRKEAFERYMKLVYGIDPIKIDMDDILEPDIFSLRPRSRHFRPPNLPVVKVDVNPPPESTVTETVEQKKKQVPLTKKTFKPIKKVTPEKPQPQPVEPTVPEENIVAEEEEEEEEVEVEVEVEPEETIPTTEELKPKTPARPRTTTPLRPREPSPELLTFLRQFADMDWFSDLYPDKKSIPSVLTPDDFSLQLLSYLQICSISTRLKVLSALQELHSQGLLLSTDRLYQGLIQSVQSFARPHMAPVEQLVLAEMFNLLVRLKPPSYELIKMLLVLLAYKNLDLRETVLRMLRTLGVEEAERWLWPEVEGWAAGLQECPDTWTSLHCRADDWLAFWTSQFKEHNRYLYLRSTAKWKPLTLNVVEVLSYFCSVQREEHKKARCVAPAGRNNTVLLPLYDCSYQPILRLGETYSMARIRRSPGYVLPPLRDRPFLSHCPPYIIFPLSRVTLSPFHFCSDEDWVKACTHRYFVPHESWVEFYR